MVLIGVVGERKSPTADSVCQRTGGGYGRTARRGVGRERGRNGNEMAIGAVGAHCRRSIRRRFSFHLVLLVAVTRVTVARTQAKLGWHWYKRCW